MIKEINKCNEDMLALLHIELIIDSLKEYSFDKEELKNITEIIESIFSKR